MKTPEDTDMTEREAFEAWLEAAEPKIPTTVQVEVAWRAWQARAAINDQPQTVRFGDVPAPESIHGFPADEQQ